MTAQPLPVIQALLAATAEAAQPARGLSVAELRAVSDAGVVAVHRFVRDHGPLHAERDLLVAGVPCRLYLPSGEAEQPLHVFLHGGGWWMGSIETADPMARELAHVSGLAVLSVDYRLAPEHPFPAGLQDVTDVLRGLDPEVLGFAPTTVSVGGESAGGNLAAVACVVLRGEVPIVSQWLDVPCTDLRCPEDESLRLYRTGYGLEIDQVKVLQSWYGGDPSDPLQSPLLTPDLSGLPPALVTTAECDPIRDQGKRYADALAAHGNDVTYLCHEGQVHASSWLTGLSDLNAQQYDETVAVLVAHHAAVAVAR